MSIKLSHSNPWLRDEKDFIKKVVEAGKPVLGICLGVQMLADIFGTHVYKNRYLEMGCFPVRVAAQEK